MGDTALDFSAIDAALEEIVTGTGVHRSLHELTIDGVDVTGRFQAALERYCYLPTRVRNVDVRPGERVPAFLIEGSKAYFGWVFWEKFTQRKLRKLWGSVVRNWKGDWALQLAMTSSTTIFANPALKSPMDIENPR